MNINSLSSQVVPIINKSSSTKNNLRIESSTSQDYSELSKVNQIISTNVPKAADQQTNSINIKPGEIKNIGSVDGSPLNISFDSNGMSSTSFGIMINNKSNIVTPLDELAAKVFNSHTPAQRDKANSIIGRFQQLYQVANGSMSVNQYNQSNAGQFVSTSEMLSSLGIDVSKPFSFNGNSFSLDAQGDLHALLPPSPVNI